MVHLEYTNKTERSLTLLDVTIKKNIITYRGILLYIFLQALSRYWRRLGLTDTPRNVLSMTMTMALLPSDRFQEAFSLIQLEANQISNKYPAICDFLNYVRKTWLPLASKVSVYDCPVRTNNITESFHNIVGKRFRKGNIWNFLGNH